MRIISPFSDYYDSAQSQGQDLSLIYKRQTHLHDFDQEKPAAPEVEWLFSAFLSRFARRQDYRPLPASKEYVAVSLRPGLVLFAGKVYPYVRAALDLRQGFPSSVDRYFYDLTELQALVESIDQKLPHQKGGRMLRRWSFHRYSNYPPVSYPDFFALAGSDALMASALQWRVPVAHQELGGALEIDGPLSPIEFYRKLNTWQAFQELSMFHGNLGQPARPMVELTDKSKVAKHGFDQYSFRKPPQSK